MSKRFDIGGAIAAATPVVYQLYLQADNGSWYNSDGAIPTEDFWLLGAQMTPNAALMCEIGVCVAAGTGFVPIYPKMYLAAGVPVNFDLGALGLKINYAHATVCKLAIRLSVAADATVRLSGDIRQGKV